MEVGAAEEESGKGVEMMRNEEVHHSLKRRNGLRDRRRRNICLGITAGVIVLVGVIILILALTLFKAKRPVIAVNSLTLKDLKVDLDVARLQVQLNVTVDVHVSIKNPNRVTFRYTNSSSDLKYKERVVGEVPIPGGKIKGHGTTPLNLTLTVMANRLLSDSNLYSDILTGALPLTTYTRVSGKVRILSLFNIHVVAYSTCDLTINITTTSIDNQTCRYKTHL